MFRRKLSPFSYRSDTKTSRQDQKCRKTLRFENLEAREMMAANLTASLSGGVLAVEGTYWNDNITVRNDGNKISIDGVSILSGGTSQASVPRAAVTSLVIDAMAGNDYIEMVEVGVGGFSKPLSMSVTGGWGDDTIKGSYTGDKLYGTAAYNSAAQSLDNSLGLYVPPEGDYYNSGGKQERWLKSAGTDWYYITPDGSLYRQTQPGYAVGSLVFKFDATYHRDVSLLSDAGSGAMAVELDKSLSLVTDGNYYQNSGGKQEKWIKNLQGEWYFIVPDGTLFKQTVYGQAAGSQIAKLDISYWQNPIKLLSASNRFTDADTIDGKSGADTIDGGADSDSLTGGDGKDVIHGNAGGDVIWGGWLNNAVYASDDADYLYGDGGNDQIHGGEGTDRIWGDAGLDNLWGDDGDDWIYGGTEGDSLFGGRGNDELWGEYGDDYLYGGDNSDRLYGGMDRDTLYGERGDDWLDAGSATEYASGGTNNDGTQERDINAWITAVGGARMNDLTQGGGSTCWILASMGAVSQYEDLSQRITYLGDSLYKVILYNRVDNMNATTGGYKYQPEYVRFDGTRINSDPLFNGQEGETWMIIMHRAIIQAVSKFDPSQALSSPHSGGAQDALAMLTGKWGASTTATALGSLDKLVQLTNSSKGVAVHTKSTTSTLVANHVYVVIGRSGSNVLLYNPWGGSLTISWNTFRNDTGAIISV